MYASEQRPEEQRCTSLCHDRGSQMGSVRVIGLLRADPGQGRGGYQMGKVPATAEQVFVRQCQAPVCEPPLRVYRTAEAQGRAAL